MRLTEKTGDERLLQRQMDRRCNLVVPDSDLALVQPHIGVLGLAISNAHAIIPVAAMQFSRGLRGWRQQNQEDSGSVVDFELLQKGKSLPFKKLGAHWRPRGSTKSFQLFGTMLSRDSRLAWI